MEKDKDLRILRTEQLIKAAFYELVETIGFDKITVANLTQKAAVNRSTFYLHYTDKFDLLNRLELEILDGLREILLTIDFEKVFYFKYEGRPYPHIVRILEYVKAHDRFYLLIMGPKGDPSFISKVGDFIRSVLYEVIVTHGFLNRLTIPVNYVFPMFVSVITSFLNEWVKTGMKETPYELAGYVTHVIHNIPRGIIDLNAAAQ